jgi:hypothetical protein
VEYGIVAEVKRICVALPVLSILTAVSTVVLLLIDGPDDSGTFHKLSQSFPYILHPHPQYIIHLILVYFQSFGITDALRYKEIAGITMSIKLDANAVVQLARNGDTCLLKHFTHCAVLRRFVLVPLALGEAELVLHLNHQQLRTVPVEDNCPADRLVLLQLRDQQLRVELQARWTVIFELKEKLVALLFLILARLGPEDHIDVVVEGFLGVVA